MEQQIIDQPLSCSNTSSSHDSDHSNNSILTSAELRAVFGNLREVLSFNSCLLRELITANGDALHLAECFVRNGAGFHVYATYCTQYATSVDTLTLAARRAPVAKALCDAQNRLNHALPLGAYLLKPVQRILKYHLLLSAVLERLLAQNAPRPAEQPLRHALALMSEIAAHINRVKRRHEHALRRQQLQHLLIGWQVSSNMR